MVNNDLEEIQKVRIAEDHNYLESRKHLGDTVSLIQDLVELYDLIPEIVKGAKIEINNKNILIINFILACRYYLTIGALTCLRGHLTDSLYFIRSAVEIAGFAQRIEKQPQLAQVWLDSIDNDESYEVYKKKFRVRKLFPKGHKLLNELYQRYKFCAQTTHPSFYQFARRMVIAHNENKMSIGMNYCELKNDDLSEPIRTLLSIADIHFRIIQIFEDIFNKEINADRIRWDLNKNSVEAKLEYHKEKWKQFCQGPSQWK